MSDIKPAHVEFARALVALAREHKIGSLDVTFRDSSSAIHTGSDFWSWKQMRMVWGEGRHGVETRITLKHEAETQIDEKDAPGVTVLHGDTISPEGTDDE
jgi:hypothetical protein